MFLRILFTAAALDRWRAIRRQKPWPWFWAAAGVCGLFVAYWACEATVLYTDRYLQILKIAEKERKPV